MHGHGLRELTLVAKWELSNTLHAEALAATIDEDRGLDDAALAAREGQSEDVVLLLDKPDWLHGGALIRHGAAGVLRYAEAASA